MIKKKHKFKYGEIFCGPGGLAFGALKSSILKDRKKYSIDHAWASDYDADSCKTFIKNICPNEPESVWHEDINLFQKRIKNLDPIDIFGYGFPCNDFSLIGKQKGFSGSFGPLYRFGMDVIKHHSPLAFVAENVGGIRSTNGGNNFIKILRDLRNCGPKYNVTHHLYKAEEYGIPQTRHRIFIVGIRKDLDFEFIHPLPSKKNKIISVKDALENPEIQTNAVNHIFHRSSQTVIERLKHIKPGENAWNAKLPAHLKLNVKGATFSQIYRRLDPNKPSPTLTGSGGGGTHGYHYKEHRSLTNRERARIQTFPDKYIFEGSIASVRKQIGMAVPPKLAKIIFTSLLKQLADKFNQDQ